MNINYILHCRLINQQIIQTPFTKPKELVSWLGAMQAQEYAMAKWAIGLRLQGSHETDIEIAFNEGSILRTHVLRPTWHFVTPEDIRWMIELTAPRINAFNDYYYRKEGLDKKTFKRCNDVLIKSLRNGKHLTRAELAENLTRAKIDTGGLRLGFIMGNAELDAIICSGPRKGKQFTYALLEERAPKAKTLPREEALAALAQRYFTSRNPAMLHDFAWWSGLTMKDVKEGVAMLPKNFRKEMIEGKEYVIDENMVSTNVGSSATLNKPQASFLMPDYDEYGIAYKDRSAIYDAGAAKETISRGNPVFNRMIVVNGRIVGSWKAELKSKEVEVNTVLFDKLNKTKQKALEKAVERYKKFLGK